VKRSSRAAAAAAVAVLAVPFWTVPAYADTGTEPASSGAYFYSAGIAKPDASPAAPPNVTASADGVEAGKLAVAARAGQVDKVSFLFFSLSNVPVGSEITKAELTVPLAGGSSNVQLAASPAKVRACKNGAEGFGGEDGTSMALAPSLLCEQFAAPAQPSADGKSYVFDISGLAAEWSQSNDGVALVPAAGADSTNFQVVFESPERAQLAYEFTPAAEEAGEATGGDTSGSSSGSTGDSGSGVTGLGGTGSTDLGGGFDAGTGSTSSGGGTGFGTVDAPLTAGGLPGAPAPETLEGEEPTVAVQNSAASGPVSSSDPTVGFWLAGLLLAGVLALTSLVLGDPRGATAMRETRQSRLSQALAAAARGGGAPSLLTARPS
jgi:hypothetical protein